MALAASEIRLLKAARKIFETGETIVRYNSVVDSHNITIYEALTECEKYFHGSYAAYRVAKERLYRRMRGVDTICGFYARDAIRSAGYAVWRHIDYGNGTGRIVPGNVSEETFNNWMILANLAYIDRIIETGEIL